MTPEDPILKKLTEIASEITGKEQPVNELFGIKGAGGSKKTSGEKYEITDESHPRNKNLKRIKALRSIPRHGVGEGDMGGYIEKASNLDQKGDCWVGGLAQVSASAWVTDNALVTGEAQVSKVVEVSDNARVGGKARVTGQAVIYGDSSVKGNARVSGSAGINGNALVTDNAVVSGSAMIGGKAVIKGKTNVSGNENITEESMTEEDEIELTNEEEDEIVGSIIDTLDDEEQDLLDTPAAGDHRSEDDKLKDLENTTGYTKKVHPVLTQESIKMSNMMIGMLRKAYEPLRGKKIPTKTAIKIRELMNQMKGDIEGLKKMVAADIPFVSRSAGTILLFDHDWDVSEIKKLYKGGKIPGISEDVIKIDGRRREFREKLRKLAYEKCKKAMKKTLRDAEVKKSDDGDDDELELEFEGKVNEVSYDKSLGDLKKTLENEYGSANFKKLKFVKIKQDIVSIQTPSGQELERYWRVPKTGWTSISEDLDESRKDIAAALGVTTISKHDPHPDPKVEKLRKKAIEAGDAWERQFYEAEITPEVSYEKELKKLFKKKEDAFIKYAMALNVYNKSNGVTEQAEELDESLEGQIQRIKREVARKKKMLDKIKDKDSKAYELLDLDLQDKINELARLFLKQSQETKNESTEEALEEKRKSKSDYEIYHDSYTSALSEVLDFVKRNGYHVDEDHWFNQVSSGPRKPSAGKTNSFNLELQKNGKDVKNRGLSFQVYGLESGRYELTVYIA